MIMAPFSKSFPVSYIVKSWALAEGVAYPLYQRSVLQNLIFEQSKAPGACRQAKVRISGDAILAANS